MADVRLISEALFDTVSSEAALSPRRRMNHNFHADAADNPHRFLNILLSGTYIRPHRHLEPPKSESFLVLEGRADVVTFDDAGHILARYRLGAATEEGRLWGVDLSPGVWHTIVARTRRVVCFEVKPGPWLPSSDKEFAPWAPAEGESGVSAYLASLLAD
jgi:cupin fold WbuC family metalloprotein